MLKPSLSPVSLHPQESPNISQPGMLDETFASPDGGYTKAFEDTVAVLHTELAGEFKREVIDSRKHDWDTIMAILACHRPSTIRLSQADGSLHVDWTLSPPESQNDRRDPFGYNKKLLTLSGAVKVPNNDQGKEIRRAVEHRVDNPPLPIAEALEPGPLGVRAIRNAGRRRLIVPNFRFPTYDLTMALAEALPSHVRSLSVQHGQGGLAERYNVSPVIPYVYTRHLKYIEYIARISTDYLKHIDVSYQPSQDEALEDECRDLWFGDYGDWGESHTTLHAVRKILYEVNVAKYVNDYNPNRTVRDLLLDSPDLGHVGPVEETKFVISD